MRKISNYIFNISPKKLAIYLILGPLVLFFVHLISSILLRTFSENNSPNLLSYSLVGIIFFFLAILVLLWLFWLVSLVYSVEKSDLGLPIRWFQITIILFVIYLLYNLCYPLVASLPEDYQSVFHPLNEFIAFGGLLIAYPVVCHYAARAVLVKQTKEPATFINAIPITLLLFFGVVLGIPFLHKYFSKKNSSNTEIIIIYAIALGVCIVLFIVGFIAAITSMI